MKRPAAFLLTLLMLFTLAACSSQDASGDAELPEESASASPSASAEPTPTPTPTPPPDPTVATLAVCGDTMVHNTIFMDAWDEASQSYDFTHIIEAAGPYVSAADYAVTNLETTFPGSNYAGYPHFRTPDEFAQNLKDLGFDLCLTANNHCMDSGFDGLSRTLDVLDQVGLEHVGTSRTQEEAENNIVVADVGGISVAFLGYTYGTNGIPLSDDAPWSVNLFNEDYMTTLSTPDTARIVSDMAKAQALDTDLICVMVHWGWEYYTTQNAYQEQIADLFLENGADVILGGHSHVLQPCEMRTYTDENGEDHTGFVCYSLGNYFSNQNKENTDLTTVLTVELTRDNVTGETSVTDWTYVPMVMVDWKKGTGERFSVVDAYALLDAGNSGIDDRLNASIERIHEILGPEHDIRYVAPVETDSGVDAANVEETTAGTT